MEGNHGGSELGSEGSPYVVKHLILYPAGCPSRKLLVALHIEEHIKWPSGQPVERH